MPNPRRISREENTIKKYYTVFVAEGRDPQEANELATKGYVDAQVGGGGAAWGDITGDIMDQDDLVEALDGKQEDLGFTPENVTNKSTDTDLGNSDTLYPTQNAVKTYVDDHAGGGGNTQVGFVQEFGVMRGADSTSIVNAAEVTGTDITPDGQPDVARRLDVAATTTIGMITIVGTSIANQDIEEVMDLTSVTGGQTLKAFLTVSRIETEANPGEHISIGVSETLGLNRRLGTRPTAGGGTFRDGVFYDGINNPVSDIDPDEIALNTWHWESYPTPADFKVYFQIYEVFDHQFS